MMQRKKVGGIGATQCRGKGLGRAPRWTTAAGPDLRGRSQGRATQAAYFLGFRPKTFTMTTSGPNPGSRAQNLGLGQMRSFLVVLEGFIPNVTTSGPNPWLRAQKHGFGPDMVIFKLTPPGASQKPS